MERIIPNKYGQDTQSETGFKNLSRQELSPSLVLPKKRYGDSTTRIK